MSPSSPTAFSFRRTTQHSSLFPEDDSSVKQVQVVRLTAAEFHDRKIQAQVAEAFPPKTFALVTPAVRSERSAYFVYLAGQALFLLGGTGLLMALYRRLAKDLSWSILAEPLQEIVGRPRLCWAVHLVYFGLYLIGATVIHQMPEFHSVMMANVQSQLSSDGKGVLAVAGQAYGSGNVLWAAFVTLTINFLLGSLLMITVPSMIIPGCGVLLAIARATLWGLLLGPAFVTLAKAMLPHTGTLLLEGAGYILATFFALLIPITLFGPQSSAQKPPTAEWDGLEAATSPVADTLGRRFVRAIVLNLKANVLVAMVLAVAACYEATEVIWLAGR